MAESKVGKPQKLAIFRSPTDTLGCELVAGEYMEMGGYVRMTEYVEVTFPALQDEAIATKMLTALELQESKIRNEFQQKLDGIAELRRNLLALTCKPAEVVVPESEEDSIPF